MSKLPKKSEKKKFKEELTKGMIKLDERVSTDKNKVSELTSASNLRTELSYIYNVILKM